MDNAFEKDTVLSHNILNYLFAGYQGQFTYWSMKQDLSGEQSFDTQKNEVGEKLAKILEWLKGLRNGDCLFSASWRSPQTFDSQKALKWLEELKAPLKSCALAIRRLSRESNIRSSHSDFVELVSTFGAFAYSGKYYTEGMMLIAQLLNRQDMAQSVQPQLQHTQAEMTHAGYFAHLLKTKGAQDYPQDYLAVLLDDAKRAPAVFQAQVHDINQILASYREGISWELLEFTPAESDLWQKAMFKPNEAGYWRAYEIGPDEAVTWFREGFKIAGIAAAWKDAGFDAARATVWASKGIAPILAKRWLAAGHDPQQAISYIARGITDPDKLPKGE